MSPKYPCIENSIDLFLNGVSVRLWINKEQISHDYREEQETIKKLMKQDGQRMHDILDWCLENIPNLNAVQVRDGAVGTVVYTTPFAEQDVHG